MLGLDHGVARRDVHRERQDLPSLAGPPTNSGDHLMLGIGDLALQHRNVVPPISYKHPSTHSFRPLSVDEGESGSIF